MVFLSFFSLLIPYYTFYNHTNNEKMLITIWNVVSNIDNNDNFNIQTLGNFTDKLTNDNL